MTFPRRKAVAAALVVAAIGAWWWGNDLIRLCQTATPSRAHGSTASGSIEFGKRFPTSGPNFTTYSRFGALLGRTSVHSTVRDILLASFSRMHSMRPTTEFVLGETGWPSGGPFPPHKTHENGTSVDLFVPVLDRAGLPTTLPTWPWNKFGYGIEFDSTGQWHGYRIDFSTLADHLLVLDSIAAAKGAPIARVILAPEYRTELMKSAAGRRALATIPWMRGKPWVRHDEHYHVDFAVPGATPPSP